MLEELQDSPVSEARVQAMLKEIVRRAVAGMIARQESESVTEISESYPDRIDTEAGHIRDAQRTRDWSVASTFAGEIARQNGLDPAALEAPAVARQVLSLLRRLNDLHARVERDFDDPLDVGRDLPPAGPSFITRVCRLDLGIRLHRLAQARRARSPQIAQASGALVAA
ncbi:hypothetical protein, partial [Sagittula sp.]|uniref:hypothetical protein n=1 Tax=Sagittula sp. TaxID=2038081 RepID=UPI0035152172